MSELKAYNEWIREVIGFYRGFDFFRAGPFAESSIEAAVQIVEQTWAAIQTKRRRDGTPVTWNNRERIHMWRWCSVNDRQVDRDTEVLRADRTRCWTFDQESVYRVEEFYKAAMRRMGEISRGQFSPVDIREIWQEADEFAERIEIEFEVGERSHKFWVLGHGDFMNTGIIAGVNTIMEGAPCQFVVHGEQDKVVFCLDTEERSGLSQRGWSFEILPRDSILQWPDAGIVEKHKPNVRGLLFLRGLMRYRMGDHTGAWLDWNEAIELGDYDYTRIPALIRSLIRQSD